MTINATIAEKVASLGTSVDFLRAQISDLQRATQENSDVMRGAPGEVGVVASIGLMKADLAENHTGIAEILKRMEGIKDHIGTLSVEIADLSQDVKDMADISARIGRLESYNTYYPSLWYLLVTNPKVYVPVVVVAIAGISWLGRTEMLEHFGGLLSIFGLPPLTITYIMGWFK